MEFREVVKRRRMWRTFRDDPIDPEVLRRILEAGHRAPSAGFTQGYAFLVLEGRAQVDRFWEAAGADEPGWEPGEGLRNAAAIVVPFASKDAYLDRYAEADKGWTDRDESWWPSPYWVVDTGFTAMLMLLAAVDEGLGAVFFGLFAPSVPAFKEAFGLPPEWEPIGAIALGHKGPDPVIGSAKTRPRKPLEEIVHWGRW